MSEHGDAGRRGRLNDGNGSAMRGLRVFEGATFETRPITARSFSEHAGVYLFLISFLSIYYLSNASVLLGHLDLGWHLAAGDLIRQRDAIPFQDPWSFTLGDKRWYNLSWLWDVIASVVFQYGGLAGLTLSVVACGAVIVGYLIAACLRSGASAIAVCISVFAACLLYPTFATDPNSYLSASPNTATMLFCAIFYAECFGKKRMFLLPIMMALWANLHGGFLLGFVVIGVFGGEALIRRDWASFKTYGLVGIACVAAIFINPLGWHLYDGIAATLGHFVQTQISEWEPYHRTMSIPGNISAIVFMLVFVLLELRYGASHAIPLAPRLLSWLFLGLGLYQFRYMSFFFIFSTIPIALHLDRVLSKQTSDLGFKKALMAAGIVGACVLPVTFLQVRPALGLSEMLSEADALYLRTHHSGSRVLNHWNVGGLLIFLTKGTVPVFVDGRAATAYPDDLLRDYLKLVNLQFDEAAWDHALAKYQIDTVLWVKAHEDLRRYLVGRKGWRESYAGRYETIYVKP